MSFATSETFPACFRRSQNPSRKQASFVFQLSFGSREHNDLISFQEVSGIDMEMSTEEVEPGGENRFKHRLPGTVKYNNLVLKRGLASKGSTLYNWVMQTLESGFASKIITKNVTISLLDASGKVLMSWDFISAYPVKWEVSNFKSAENELAIETLELAYDFFKKN